jgi:DNA-binding transcriptional ArsR family regulator
VPDDHPGSHPVDEDRRAFRAPTSVEELRELRDPRTMRALAHPVRMDLLEALALEGSLTATEAGALIGQSATTCSFHLRQLAKYGFVEDAGRSGTRERPWRLTLIGTRIPEATGEADVDLAADALTKVLLERYIDRMRRAWRERHEYPPRWREATGFSETVLFVTAEEMEEVGRTIEEVIFRFAERLANPAARPADALPVELLTCSYLMRPEEKGAP